MTEKPTETKTKTTNSLKHIPKDAQVIMSIMKDMDIEEYEPRVINQLLEFTYRYVTCILDDARIYAKHAKKKEIDLDDVKLAIDMVLEKSFTTPPSRETLLELARKKNSTPLPLLKPHAGIRLPPDRYCLSACNYRMKPATKKQIKVVPSFGNQQNIKGPQKPGITVSTVLKRTGALPQMTKTQTVTIPKPVIKFSTTAQQKAIVKPKTQIITATTPQIQTSQASQNSNVIGGQTSSIQMPMETDDGSTMKRKREDDDYDAP
ncbi:transcription initiation factor TFIID subunit 9 isoform X2 [Chrysoperla carnea]|uniref:transcription initiation factor TFIID subunit 9 isoform X2 n=1 Tax=Chrysoperla carnea TaxID=189513 RepID=UPI001D06E503|nr:transcription initiation factor TFIID subunit 9 isoform X2 [Chrysoperla carnea]